MNSSVIKIIVVFVLNFLNYFGNYFIKNNLILNKYVLYNIVFLIGLFVVYFEIWNWNKIINSLFNVIKYGYGLFVLKICFILLLKCSGNMFLVWENFIEMIMFVNK